MDLVLNPPVHFVGKIIALSPFTGPNGEERYLFGSPHGSVFELGREDMDEPSLDDLDYLLSLENRATTEEKVLYGGQVAITETLRILAKRAS